MDGFTDDAIMRARTNAIQRRGRRNREMKRHCRTVARYRIEGLVKHVDVIGIMLVRMGNSGLDW